MCTTNIHFTDYNFANETTNYSDLLESRSRQKMNRYKKKRQKKNKHRRPDSFFQVLVTPLPFI